MLLLGRIMHLFSVFVEIDGARIPLGKAHYAASTSDEKVKKSS